MGPLSGPESILSTGVAQRYPGFCQGLSATSQLGELLLTKGYNISAGYYRVSGTFMGHPRQSCTVLGQAPAAEAKADVGPNSE